MGYDDGDGNLDYGCARCIFLLNEELEGWNNPFTKHQQDIPVAHDFQQFFYH